MSADGAGGADFGAGGVGLCGGASLKGAVGPDGVVVAAERVQLFLQVLDGVGRGLGGEPFLQRLLESLDFALGLWVVGAAVLLRNVQQP